MRSKETYFIEGCLTAEYSTRNIQNVVFSMTRKKAKRSTEVGFKIAAGS